MILDVLLWLPTKVLRRFLPVTSTFGSIGELTNQSIDDYFKENSL